MSQVPIEPNPYDPTEASARSLDERDPLASYRDRFCIPTDESGRPLAYFCGNSLGLLPSQAREAVEQELDSWARLAVDAHFNGPAPWYPYHELFRESAAGIVGARPGEVVMMNGLTTNLHLMLVSFYRPTAERYRILMELRSRSSLLTSRLLAIPAPTWCSTRTATTSFPGGSSSSTPQPGL